MDYKKPEFPKPRLIREDFLPNESMSKYRIKKVTDEGGHPTYHLQKRILWWWVTINLKGFDYFFDIESAKKYLNDLNATNKIKVEYIYDLE